MKSAATLRLAMTTGMMMNDSHSASRATTHSSALVTLHLAVILFGFAGLFGKWVALAPATIVFGRSFVATMALAALLRLLHEPRGRFQWRLMANGAILALHWLAFFQAIQLSSVAIGLLGYASFPLFVLALETALLRRPLHAGEWATAALVTIGLLLIVPELKLENKIVQGLLWALLSGFTFALLAVGNRALVAQHSAGEIALWQNGCAALCLLPIVVFERSVPAARDVGLLVLLGVVCTALAHTLFIRSMRALSAHGASVVAALEPVYGIALAFLLLHEAPEPRTLAGAVLIVAAAILASRRTNGL